MGLNIIEYFIYMSEYNREIDLHDKSDGNLSPIANQKDSTKQILETSDDFVNADGYQILNLETGKFDPARPATRLAHTKFRPSHKKNQGSLPEIKSPLYSQSLEQMAKTQRHSTSQTKLRFKNKKKKYAPYSLNMLKSRINNLNKK